MAKKPEKKNAERPRGVYYGPQRHPDGTVRKFDISAKPPVEVSAKPLRIRDHDSAEGSDIYD